MRVVLVILLMVACVLISAFLDNVCKYKEDKVINGALRCINFVVQAALWILYAYIVDKYLDIL